MQSPILHEYMLSPTLHKYGIINFQKIMIANACDRNFPLICYISYRFQDKCKFMGFFKFSKIQLNFHFFIRFAVSDVSSNLFFQVFQGFKLMI